MFAIKVYDAPSFIQKIKDGKLKIFYSCFLIILIRRGNGREGKLKISGNRLSWKRKRSPVPNTTEKSKV